MRMKRRKRKSTEKAPFPLETLARISMTTNTTTTTTTTSSFFFFSNTHYFLSSPPSFPALPFIFTTPTLIKK
ncbi:hypothetical protein LguiA_000649 [Lonicera macranthoides]